MIATTGHLPSSFSGILLLIAWSSLGTFRNLAALTKCPRASGPSDYPLRSLGGLSMFPLETLSQENLAYTNLTKR